MNVREMGLKLQAGSEQLPFLKTGTTAADFHIILIATIGKVP